MEAVPYLTLPERSVIWAGGPASLAVIVAEHSERWLPLLAYDADGCQSRLLEHTDDRAVWLMSWLPGQGTDLHNHGDICGAFAVAAGTLTERLPAGAAGLRDTIRTFEPGHARVFGPHYTHQLLNAGRGCAVSVHVHGAGPSRTPRPSGSLHDHGR